MKHIDSDGFMGMHIGNVAVVVGDHDVGRIQNTLKIYYDLTVGTVQRVTSEQPYTGEIRDRNNTLVHIATPNDLPNDLYDTKTIRDSIDLESVGMSPEILERADLVLVLLKGKNEEIYYYPYKVALYLTFEE